MQKRWFSIKNRLLDEAISTVQKEILDCSYERDMEDIISMYLKCIDVRFGQDSEREMHKQVIDWKVFETASEPELKNYAYTRWRKAIIRAKRQLQLLYAYLEKHPDSAKTKKCIDMSNNKQSTSLIRYFRPHERKICMNIERHN